MFATSRIFARQQVTAVTRWRLKLSTTDDNNNNNNNYYNNNYYKCYAKIIR
jgi:hypothetical protein